MEQFGEPVPEAVLQDAAKTVQRGSVGLARLPEGWVAMESVLPDDVVAWKEEMKAGLRRDPGETGGAAPEGDRGEGGAEDQNAKALLKQHRLLSEAASKKCKNE